MKELPEKIVQLLQSQVEEDIWIGLHLALDYADRPTEFSVLIHDVYNKIPLPKNRLSIIVTWHHYFTENKVGYEE